MKTSLPFYIGDLIDLAKLDVSKGIIRCLFHLGTAIDENSLSMFDMSIEGVKLTIDAVSEHCESGVDVTRETIGLGLIELESLNVPKGEMGDVSPIIQKHSETSSDGKFECFSVNLSVSFSGALMLSRELRSRLERNKRIADCVLKRKAESSSKMKMPFGMFRGKSVEEVIESNLDYLECIMKNPGLVMTHYELAKRVSELTDIELIPSKSALDCHKRAVLVEYLDGAGLSEAQKSVFLALYDFTRASDGEITVAASSIAKYVGKSVDTVYSATSKLREIGLIKTSSHLKSDGKRTTNTYTVL